MRMWFLKNLRAPALLAATLWAGAGHAQGMENAPLSPIAPLVTPAVSEPLMSNSEIEALVVEADTLRREMDAVGARMVELIALNNTAQAERTRQSDALDLCKAGRQVDEETLIALNERLAECSAQPAPEPAIDTTGAIPALEARVAELEARAIQAEASLIIRDAMLQTAQDSLTEMMNENQDLRNRLETLGFSAVPGFRYFGGDGPTSFLSLSDLRYNSLGGLVPEADQCDAAIAWLRDQATQGGRQVPIQWLVWVQLPNGFAICSRNASNNGSVGPIVERGTTEAHVIEFQ